MEILDLKQVKVIRVIGEGRLLVWTPALGKRAIRQTGQKTPDGRAIWKTFLWLATRRVSADTSSR